MNDSKKLGHSIAAYNDKLMDSHSPISAIELRTTVETGIWIGLIAMPILSWINGPSVSNDQAIMRYILAAVLVVGAFCSAVVRLWQLSSSNKTQ